GHLAAPQEISRAPAGGGDHERRLHAPVSCACGRREGRKLAQKRLMAWNCSGSMPRRFRSESCARRCSRVADETAIALPTRPNNSLIPLGKNRLDIFWLPIIVRCNKDRNANALLPGRFPHGGHAYCAMQHEGSVNEA